MAEPNPQYKFRIATVGYGIVGATLANTFSRCAHIEFRVYSFTQEFLRSYHTSNLDVIVDVLDQFVSSAEDLLNRAGAKIKHRSSHVIVSTSIHTTY